MGEESRTRRASLDPLREPVIVRDEPVGGIVLAGGRSRRMGRDKAWMELGNRPLVAWVLDALREVTVHQIIVARHVGRLETLGVPVVLDRIEARGPLTGIHAGLKASKVDLNVVVAVDLPLARPALLRYLAAAIGPRHAAIPHVGEGGPPAPHDYLTARQAGLQPLCAAYRRACIPRLEKLLASGSHAASSLAALVPTRIVDRSDWRRFDHDGRSFFNINTPEDLVAVTRLLAELGTDDDPDAPDPPGPTPSAV